MNDLLGAHDALFADLDGTLYRGPTAIPGAVEAVAGATARGIRTVYVTNNASRGPAAVAGHLSDLGFPARSPDVVTSAQAAGAVLAQRLPRGATVLVVGTEALVDEVATVGLRPVREAAGAVAVVQGHDPTTGWPALAEAALAVRAGAEWVACNLDVTLPTERGLLPGNGAMVAAVGAATGRAPMVAGKPDPSLMRQAAARSDARSPLVVGDRLDTDIAAGRAAGLPTLLVLTGVGDPAGLLAAPPSWRPDYVGADLAALTGDPTSLRVGSRQGWTVDVIEPGLLRLAGHTAHTDPVDALRALCAQHWATGGGPARVAAVDESARAALDDLGLAAAEPGRSAEVSRQSVVPTTGGPQVAAPPTRSTEEP